MTIITVLHSRCTLFRFCICFTFKTFSNLILWIGESHIHGFRWITSFVGTFEVGKRAAVYFAFDALLKRLVRNVTISELLVDDTFNGQRYKTSFGEMCVSVGGNEIDFADGKVASVFGDVEGITYISTISKNKG